MGSALGFLPSARGAERPPVRPSPQTAPAAASAAAQARRTRSSSDALRGGGARGLSLPAISRILHRTRSAAGAPGNPCRGSRLLSAAAPLLRVVTGPPLRQDGAERGVTALRWTMRGRGGRSGPRRRGSPVAACSAVHRGARQVGGSDGSRTKPDVRQTRGLHRDPHAAVNLHEGNGVPVLDQHELSRTYSTDDGSDEVPSSKAKRAHDGEADPYKQPKEVDETQGLWPLIANTRTPRRLPTGSVQSRSTRRPDHCSCTASRGRRCCW